MLDKKRFAALNVMSVTLWALLVLPAHSAQAQVDYLDLSPEQLLNAQVISASKTEQRVAEAPSAVYVITQEDIARSGMTSIPELLRMVPGVNVAQADSNTWAVSIRGFNKTLANKLLVMIDGRTVYNPLFAGTYWEAQDLPLEDIAQIEVIRGPGGTLWGANAVNGVINIITKNARDTQGTLVSGGAGNYERGFATGRYGGSSGGDVFYRTYLKANDRGSFRAPAGGDAPDSWQSYRGGFRADWDKSPQTQATIQGDVYRVNSDQLNQSYSLTAPYSSVMPETIRSKGANILARWKHDNNNASSFSVQTYLDYTKRDEELIGDTRTIYDLEGQYNFRPLGRHELIMGANYRWISDDLRASPIVSFNPASVSQNLYGFFAQDKITLQPERWYLIVGSKFEHNDYTGFEYQPNVRLEWLPDAQQTVWSSVSRAVRTPSRVESDLNITNVVFPPGGIFGADPTKLVLTENKNFKAEDLTAYELGYRKQIRPDLSVDTTAFINNYRNLGTLDAGTYTAGINNGVDPIHNLLPLIQVNDMSAEVYGAEVAASWEANPDWKLSASYTFLDMYLHAPLLFGTNQETAEHQTPNHQAGLRSYWNINQSWSFDTGLYYVGELQDYDVPAYVRLDANLGWEINPGLRFNLVGQNLLEGAHREFSSAGSVNAAEVPRSVFGKVTCKF